MPFFPSKIEKPRQCSPVLGLSGTAACFFCKKPWKNNSETFITQLFLWVYHFIAFLSYSWFICSKTILKILSIVKKTEENWLKIQFFPHSWILVFLLVYPHLYWKLGSLERFLKSWLPLFMQPSLAEYAPLLSAEYAPMLMVCPREL